MAENEFRDGDRPGDSIMLSTETDRLKAGLSGIDSVSVKLSSGELPGVSQVNVLRYSW
jgi:hypothetical protein